MNVQVAAQQPPTTAKIILYTSHGQIDIQLWTKQAPLTCRNFLQHCINGYYVNTIFHRLIPGFMIQGGDPSGTGMGGQSIYQKGQAFRDQFHQRLKFTKRGILAMANSGKNTNKSQFFITFGPCQHLNKKHTIFGKVVGDTIYNVMALQSLDTGEQDRPNDPPVIRKIKVVENPFNDLIISNQIKLEQNKSKLNKNQKLNQVEAKRIQIQAKQTKKELKNLKNRKKLTFQDQQQQLIQTQSQSKTPRIVSSHDVLYKKDTSLSNKVSITQQQLQKKRKQKQLEKQKAQQFKQKLTLKDNQGLEEDQQNNVNNNKVNKILSKQMNKKMAQFDKQKLTGNQKLSNLSNQDQDILQYQKRYNSQTKKFQIIFKDQLEKQRIEKQKEQEQKERKLREEQQIADQKLRSVRQLQKKQYSLLKADELNFKKAKQGSLKQRRKQIIHQEKKLLSNLQKHRYEYQKKQKQQQLQGQLFGKLMGFATRLKSGPGQEVKQKTEKVEQNIQTMKQGSNQLSFNKTSWMNHRLKFHIDSSNAYKSQEKGLRSNLANRSGKLQDQDDGGLKMQVDEKEYYLQDEEDEQLKKLYRRDYVKDEDKNLREHGEKLRTIQKAQQNKIIEQGEEHIEEEEKSQ